MLRLDDSPQTATCGIEARWNIKFLLVLRESCVWVIVLTQRVLIGFLRVRSGRLAVVFVNGGAARFFSTIRFRLSKTKRIFFILGRYLGGG